MSMHQTPASHLDVIAALRAVIPASVALAGGRIVEATSPLFAEEIAAVQRAIEKRRREFIAGRQYARSAMSQLGMRPVPITILPSRAPNWPPGLTGSISHSGDVCVVVVAADSEFIGVGIDIELANPLPPELYASVCSSSELSSATYCGDQAKMLFVVKEAFFKLYHPLTGYFLDFLDVTVRLDFARGAFSIALREGPPSVLGRRVFEGVCGHAGEYCFAFVALPTC